MPHDAERRQKELLRRLDWRERALGPVEPLAVVDGVVELMPDQRPNGGPDGPECHQSDRPAYDFARPPHVHRYTTKPFRRPRPIGSKYSWPRRLFTGPTCPA